MPNQYKSLLYEGKCLTFKSGSAPELEIRYHTDMMFSVPGDATFPARDPMTYWHLRAYYKKYAPCADYRVMDYHPLQMIWIEVDEPEPMSLDKWLEFIGDNPYPSYPVKDGKRLEQSSGNIIKTAAEKAITIRQLDLASKLYDITRELKKIASLKDE
jgi:hypothetical protein